MKNTPLIIPKKHVFFLLIAILISGTVSFAQSYAVLNASSSQGANGIYFPDGTYSGATKYNNGSFN